jgi:hypothetical protein
LAVFCGFEVFLVLSLLLLVAALIHFGGAAAAGCPSAMAPAAANVQTVLRTMPRQMRSTNGLFLMRRESPVEPR